MTMSQSASACAPRPGVMRPSVAETEAVASASDIFPFFTALLASFSTEPVIRFMPPSRKRCSCSTAMTLKPFSAAVCAIPWPIRPRPTTPTVVMPCDASAEKRRTCDERSAGERRRPRDSMMTRALDDAEAPRSNEVSLHNNKQASKQARCASNTLRLRCNSSNVSQLSRLRQSECAQGVGVLWVRLRSALPCRDVLLQMLYRRTAFGTLLEQRVGAHTVGAKQGKKMSYFCCSALRRASRRTRHLAPTRLSLPLRPAILVAILSVVGLRRLQQRELLLLRLEL